MNLYLIMICSHIGEQSPIEINISRLLSRGVLTGSIMRVVIASQSLALRGPSSTLFTCVEKFQGLCPRYIYATRHVTAFYKAKCRCSFTTAATVIKICANDNAVRATRNDPVAAEIRGTTFILSRPSLLFGKSRFACNPVVIAFPRCLSYFFPDVGSQISRLHLMFNATLRRV